MIIKQSLHEYKGCHLQDSPLIRPSESISMRLKAAPFGIPGISIIFPVNATMKPAPLETFTSLT